MGFGSAEEVNALVLFVSRETVQFQSSEESPGEQRFIAFFETWRGGHGKFVEKRRVEKGLNPACSRPFFR